MAIKIADAHTHIYPAKIAEKATVAIGEFYEIPMDATGTSDLLIKSGKKIDVEKYLVCSAATTPNQVESINNFIYSEAVNHPEFIPFAAMHRDYDNYKAELERVKSLGFKGVKFHPDFQKFYIDDEAMLPIYRECMKQDLIVLFHMGDERYDYSEPKRLCRVLRELPEFKCIAAHFGGYQAWTEADKSFTELFSDGLGKNLYFDTSSTLFKLDKRKAKEMIEKFGEDRFMFGSDFPMWKHNEELERFNSIDLSEVQKEKILYGNFEKIFLK